MCLPDTSSHYGHAMTMRGQFGLHEQHPIPLQIQIDLAALNCSIINHHHGIGTFCNSIPIGIQMRSLGGQQTLLPTELGRVQIRLWQVGSQGQGRETLMRGKNPVWKFPQIKLRSLRRPWSNLMRRNPCRPALWAASWLVHASMSFVSIVREVIRL